MDEIRDRVPTTSNQAKGVKEDPLASRSLAKEPCKEASWKATKGGDVCIA